MLHLEKPFYFTVKSDCYCTWPTEVHSTVSYQYVNLDICREVWSFAAFGEITPCFEIDLTIYFLCLTKMFFIVFCLVHVYTTGSAHRSSAHFCGWMWTPRLQSESCFSSIHAVLIFTLYTGIMSSAGYNCENVYNHEIFIKSLLLVQHLPDCLIWLEVKTKKNLWNVQRKIF